MSKKKKSSRMDLYGVAAGSRENAVRGRDPDLARLKADSHASMMDKVEQLRKFRESEAASRRDRYGLTEKDYLADDDPRLRNRERVSAYARHFRR